MDDRITYYELKQWFLEDGFQWCQEKFRNGKINKWVGNETEWGGANYSFENSFETPLENLMLYTLAVITEAGRDGEVYYNNLMREIYWILSGNNINDLVFCLDEDEKAEFLYDLNLVLNNQELE